MDLHTTLAYESAMQVKRHFLPMRPELEDWLNSTVPQPGMLVWLEGRLDTMPILIGHISGAGDGRGLTRFGDLRVLAYAQIDLGALSVVNA
jgi:hypothetical protein